MPNDLFLDADEYVEMAHRDRLSFNPNSLASWGIDYLDFAFGGGVAPKSFSLIACESGKGKTTLSSTIAVENGKRGNKVALIRLEGDINEFTDFEKWKIILPQLKRRDPTISPEIVNYQSYRLGKIDNIEAWDIEARDLVRQNIVKNVKLYNKKKYPSVSKKTIAGILEAIGTSVDLIIIDHLHYFEITDEKRQYVEQMETVKIINQFVDQVGTPVIIVSHMRKKDGRNKSGLMELDDIHGSSDIYKIVHNVVFMSPYYEEYQDDKKLYPTLIYTPKGRYGASKTRIGIKTFDGWSQSYLPGFETAQKRYKNGSVVILRDTDREKIIASNPF